jgi:Uma2 family endonuclease
MIAALENPAVRRLAQPLSVAAYHLLRDTGLVGVKTELIDGVVVEKTGKSPLHEYLSMALFTWFSRNTPEPVYVRKKAPLTLAGSEPEPDISIVRGRAGDFKTSHPQSAELVVEVAVSSLLLDREKAGLYAAAGVAEYWLVDAQARPVEVYRDPVGGNYRQRRIYQASETVPTPFSVALELAEVFGGE